ncbi:site-2 protease family protein [Trichlorobacter ammonificans]|uniref:Peptidase M50 n=1 Tax=Trichlorobacter ammonificans TaxID=2916410 RepID=A0ABN8HI95_9BACT|nr:site-2 protease family protein [Trichlorobacter ammonificans]CAH2031708.1 Peptidase M50 [Trichlorobacter ammonificans]
MEDYLLKISIMLVPGLMAITFHEVAHGYVAWHFGDPTARMLGRLTINPLKHLDIVGTLMMLLIGIGWAKPVPVVAENLRNPARDMIWVAAAGPITNMVLAVLSAVVFRGLVGVVPAVPADGLAGMVLTPVLLMLIFSIYINLLLAIFNLLPIPPLDGGRIMVGILPRPLSDALAGLERFGMIIILLLVVTRIINPLILPLHSLAFDLLVGSGKFQILKPLMQ